jgi:hypothetical protein
MSESLAQTGFFVPGYAKADRSYWLCPVVMPNKELFKPFCEAQGVFCFVKATQLAVVELPKDKQDIGLAPPTNCQKMMKNIVFLPCHLAVPKREMDIMIKRFQGICFRYHLLAEFMSKQRGLTLAAKTPQLQAKL